MTARKERRLRWLADKVRKADVDALLGCGWIKDESELPTDAVLVNPRRAQSTASWNTKFLPYYLDVPFTCVDCGIEQVWSAASRKWYCEVAGGDLLSLPLRCRACRKKKRERKRQARIALGLDTPDETTGK